MRRVRVSRVGGAGGDCGCYLRCVRRVLAAEKWRWGGRWREWRIGRRIGAVDPVRKV